jgi:hypothetical protein
MRHAMRKLLLGCAMAGAFAAAQAPAQDAPEEKTGADGEREALEPRVSSAALEEQAQVRREEDGGERVIDRLELERTEVTGNQELPKVLYIVPWQKPDPGDLMGRPVNSLLDEVLAPLDREEFIRQVDYYSDLYGVAGEEE